MRANAGVDRQLGGVAPLAILSPAGVLQEGHVDVGRVDVDVAHDGAADEDGGDSLEVRVALGVENLDLLQLAVEVLVDAVQHALDLEVVLELDGHQLGLERLEEGEEQHRGWVAGELVAVRWGSGRKRDGIGRYGGAWVGDVVRAGMRLWITRVTKSGRMATSLFLIRWADVFLWKSKNIFYRAVPFEAVCIAPTAFPLRLAIPWVS